MKNELEIGLKTVQNRLNENTESPSENQNRSKIESIYNLVVNFIGPTLDQTRNEFF